MLYAFCVYMRTWAHAVMNENTATSRFGLPERRTFFFFLHAKPATSCSMVTGRIELWTSVWQLYIKCFCREGFSDDAHFSQIVTSSRLKPSSSSPAYLKETVSPGWAVPTGNEFICIHSLKSHTFTTSVTSFIIFLNCIFVWSGLGNPLQ